MGFSLFKMKKKNKKFEWKEMIIALLIVLIIAGLIVWGLYSRNNAINKTCSEKITELKGFENCKYVDWQSVNDNIYKCLCIENHELKEFVVTKEETRK